MKNFSITTAFISLLSLYGYESLATEISNNKNSNSNDMSLVSESSEQDLSAKFGNIANQNLSNESEDINQESKMLYQSITEDAKDKIKNLSGAIKKESAKMYNNTKDKSVKIYNDMKNNASDKLEGMKNKASDKMEEVKDIRNYNRPLQNDKSLSKKLGIDKMFGQQTGHYSAIQKLHDQPRLTFKGSAISQMWYASEKNTQDKDISHTGKNVDAILKFTIEHGNRNLALTYGTNLQTDLAFVNNYLDASKKEATVFVKSPYGQFKIGYDHGVDADMRIDGTSLQAGSAVMPVNLKGTIAAKTPDHGQFYTSPVLWSESISNLSNVYLHDKNDEDSIINVSTGNSLSHKKRTISRSLPMRATFISPNFFGAQLGVSYSPGGYDKKIFTNTNIDELTEKSSAYNAINDEIAGEWTKFNNEFNLKQKDPTNPVINPYLTLDELMLDDVHNSPIMLNTTNSYSDAQKVSYNNLLTAVGDKLRKKDTAKTLLDQAKNGHLYAPTYRHVVNAGLTFDYDFFDEVTTKFSITGEYAKANGQAELDGSYTSYSEGYDVLAGAIGFNANYMGVDIGASYGYLGKSGLVKNSYMAIKPIKKAVETEDNMETNDSSEGNAGFDPDTLIGNRGDDDENSDSVPTIEILSDPLQSAADTSVQPTDDVVVGDDSTTSLDDDTARDANAARDADAARDANAGTNTEGDANAGTNTEGDANAGYATFAAPNNQTGNLQSATDIKDDDSHKTYYMTAGIGYRYEKAYFSLNYMQSSFQKNKYSNIGVGAEYNLNPRENSKGDYKVFINFNRFNTKQNDVEKNKGYVISGGIKFNF